MNGVIVADKPAGWTSHDVVGKVRRFLPRVEGAGSKAARVGHLGTLDPLATGVLPLMIGRATRLARFFSNDKRYDAVVRLGIVTDTYDRDGEALSAVQNVGVTRDQVEVALKRFRGTVLQVPPPVSAKKIAGRRAYELTRKKIPVQLQPAEVTIYSIALKDFDGLRARIEVHCSAGTYVRSIAHELGHSLGCGAILEELRRTASGDFTEAQAHTIESLQKLAEEENLYQALIPAPELLPQLPCERVNEAEALHIRQGRDFRVSPFRAGSAGAGGPQYVKAVTASGELIAIGEAKLPFVYHPILVL